MTVQDEPLRGTVCLRCGTFAPLKRVWAQDVCEPWALRVAPAGLAAKIAILVRTAWPLLLPAALISWRKISAISPHNSTCKSLVRSDLWKMDSG